MLGLEAGSNVSGISGPGRSGKGAAGSALRPLPCGALPLAAQSPCRDDSSGLAALSLSLTAAAAAEVILMQVCCAVDYTRGTSHQTAGFWWLCVMPLWRSGRQQFIPSSCGGPPRNMCPAALHFSTVQRFRSVTGHCVTPAAHPGSRSGTCKLLLLWCWL